MSKSPTPWPVVAVLGILGLLWLTMGGPATCRAYGGPVQVQATHQLAQP
jgi:hypothetical protein